MGRKTGRPVGRPPIHEKAMTPAERQQRSRFMREKKWAGRELRRPGQNVGREARFQSPTHLYVKKGYSLWANMP
jgi:hypothetical protein